VTGPGDIRAWLPIAGAVAVATSGLVARLGWVLPDALAVPLYAATIVAAGFLLVWTTEVLQLRMAQGVTLALLALVAVLPEYVVDGSYAWLAGREPRYAEFALANMTGANRLLIGIGWPLLMLVAGLAQRRTSLALPPQHRLNVVVLACASVYAFALPWRGGLGWFDALVLIAIFGFYLWQISGAPRAKPHLVGPERWIAKRPPRARWLLTGALGLGAAGAILGVAEPFARGLVDLASALGMSEFHAVQWLAPLASESPELIVVLIVAASKPDQGFGTLVSSKINQWTLLVGMLPLIYAVSLGALEPLPMDARQRAEVFLTAAQSLAAATLLLDLRFTVIRAGLLAVLFLVQFVWPETRYELGAAYLAVAAAALLYHRHIVWEGIRKVRSSRRRARRLGDAAS
jgi:cation:H+ antiporter